MQDHEHPQRTRRNQYRYLFTTTHHGGGSAHDASWLPSVSEDEEFAVFDGADESELADEDGNLYGILREGGEGLRYLGTWQQQIAEFPFAREGNPWHGYPLWPLKGLGPENRRGEKFRPEKEVFTRMVQAGLITTRERRRLLKGEYA